MPDTTIVIPVGPGHERIADRAAASAHAQTAPCHVVMVHDIDGKGPAWARNQGLAQVKTPYVVFLDADDVIAPTFVARCLAAPSPGRYVYTDWWQGERYVSAPDAAWQNGTWHIITALLPTKAVKAADGFDETLPGGEDTDFYMKLTHVHRVCGVHVPEALVAYTNEGRRAHAFVNGPDYARVRGLYQSRYGHLPMPCMSAGPLTLAGHPDGVTAVALWRGNRRERGAITGYLYPRAGNGTRLRVHPDDAKAAPHLFQPVNTPQLPTTPPSWVPSDLPRFSDTVAMVANALGYNGLSGAMPAPRTVTQGPPTPDVERVLSLYRQAVADE